MFSRLRLGYKLMIAPMLVLLVLLVVSILASHAIGRQGRAIDNIVQQRAAQTRSAAELSASARQAHAEVYQMIAWMSASFSTARTGTLVRGIHRRHAATERSFATLLRLTGGDADEVALVRQTDRAWRVYLASVLEVIELARNDQSISANAMTRADHAFDTVLLRLDALTRLEQVMGERAAASALEESNALTTLMPVALAVALALALVATMALRRALQDELDAIVAASIALGEGDLRAMPRVQGNDEICRAGRALAVAREQLNRRLLGVLDAARADATDVHAHALALARSVMAFRLDETVRALPPARVPRHEKGMPRPKRSGHPYLRLAASRR